MATRIELHDAELPGFIKTIIETVETQITGEKQGKRRKAAAVAELERNVKLPTFLPTPLKKMLLGLMVETIFKLLANAAEELFDALRPDAEEKAAKIVAEAEEKAAQIIAEAEKAAAKKAPAPKAKKPAKKKAPAKKGDDAT
jgi:regulator of protease activity HflC (stomatin/prohibitin superfamily)